MWRKIIGSAVLVVILTLSFVGVAGASDFRTGPSPSVTTNQVVNHTLWTAGQTIDVAGRVNGDAFCAGQDVVISGQVNGDVICAAQTITVSGTINGNMRIAGSTVTLTGKVTGNVTVASQNFTQVAGSSIGGDVSLVSTSATFNGKAGRDLLLASNTASINGSIGRNIQADVNNLTLGDGATVAGNLKYTSQNDALLATGAKIDGTITKTLPPSSETNTAAAMFWGRLAFGFYSLLALLLIGLVLVLIAPRAFNTVTSVKLNRIWKPLLVGLLAMIVVPILSIVTMTTVIGLPLGLLMLVIWVVIGCLSLIVAAYWFGRVIWQGQRNAITIMVIGILALTVLMAIPILGAIVWFLASLLGSGLILMNLQKRLPKANYTVAK